MMDPKIKSDWLKALRSGEYQQATGVMKTPDSRCCCLGVLCAVQGETFEGADKTVLMSNFVKHEYAAGLSGRAQHYLAGRNDRGWSFTQIADYIEESL